MSGFQKKIRAGLEEIFSKNNEVITVWEGGSAATGYLDQYSDLDLAVICSDDSVEQVFIDVENFLETNYGIKNKFRMPEPNWHGHSQCFYILENSPELFYVDMLIEKESAKNRFMESDRHGTAIVWLDRKNLIDQTETQKEITFNNCKSQYLKIKETIPFALLDVEKQILRDNEIDAFSVYYGIVNRLIALMNIKYRPAKYDFGARYLHRDFPKSEASFIEKMMFVDSLESLRKNMLIIKTKFYKLLSEFDVTFK